MANVELCRPSELGRADWKEMQDIAGEAFMSSLEKSKSEIDYLIGADLPGRYASSHYDPNTEVGKKFNDNQSFTKPTVARVLFNGKLAGWGYSANNVSGSNEAIRTAKRLSIVKNYLWLREIVVKPEHQKLGIAKDIGRSLLEDAMDLQPVTIYAWPEEDPNFIGQWLDKLGFVPTGDISVKLFGKNSEPTKQVRMLAPSVKSVLARL
ncbi:MAG TPA: hypothetical protein VII94_05000 [Candidatus Saccharimonadales bacterium]